MLNSMELDQFLLSLSDSHPPSSLSAHLQALWWEKKGDWERAHIIVQGLSDQLAACIHAYLHRREGDLGNAAYWDRRAGSCFSEGRQVDMDEEWLQLVNRASAS